jgi:hypothetical protein
MLNPAHMGHMALIPLPTMGSADSSFIAHLVSLSENKIFLMFEERKKHVFTKHVCRMTLSVCAHALGEGGKSIAGQGKVGSQVTESFALEAIWGCVSFMHVVQEQSGRRDIVKRNSKTSCMCFTDSHGNQHWTQQLPNEHYNMTTIPLNKSA